MSTAAIGAEASAEATIAVVRPGDVAQQDKAPADNDGDRAYGLHSPPDSNNAMRLDGSDSELSDLDDDIADAFVEGLLDALPTTTTAATPPPASALEEDDIGDITPDHFSGTVPVFKPTMHQFKDFKRFMEKIDSYGMKSGIVKVIPPQEWKDNLPALDNLVKTVRVREPIKQDIMGSNGTYRQVNILHQRSYNLPQWRQLCDQSEHQPPARRGERRANAEKAKAAIRARAPASSRPATAPTGRRRGRGRGGRGRGRGRAVLQVDAAEEDARPMTPVSPMPEEDVTESVEKDPGMKCEEEEDDDIPVIRRMGGVKPKTQSTSARRKYAKREGSAVIDEEAFKNWDYKMDVSDYTPERCEELERIYWKTLTYAQPLYGADLPGTLFDENTECWNLNNLPNLLDVMGTKIPGVNTAYLYLGMWKATFAWHLEDVDLYSINYLHFGAPKQWYSISQADARRFEAAMKSIWPTEAKSCDQFLRHKAFLISPSHLLQHFNIKVNKVVSYPGEFVVTYPYGYHSGYNLGYNCAEAVNFALDSWLPMAKIAKKCQCAQAQDSVWIDVYEIERKLRGESTEYEETDDEDDEDEDEDESVLGFPTPPSSHARVKIASRKRKRAVGEKDRRPKTKKIRLRIKTQAEPPCCLCPNDIPGSQILPTDDSRKAHRLCALYLPETFIETVDGNEVVGNASNIAKARLDLKCLYCRSKRGACLQCSQNKCARSYHATCAAAAGVFVEEAEVPVFGEDGTEYKEQAFQFSCRFHRTKRDRKLDGPALEGNLRIRDAASALKKGVVCQLQYYHEDIFAGVVVENRRGEENLLVDIIPNGDRVEVEWKWLLLADPADYRLPKASPNALPMPASQKAKDHINATKRITEELPRADDIFVENFIWKEFHTCDSAELENKEQIKVDFSKTDQIWHYLGRNSTDLRAQYTENLSRPKYNPKGNFLDTIPKPPTQPRRSKGAAFPGQRSPASGARLEKPYVYKPRKSLNAPPYAAQLFAPAGVTPANAQQGSFRPDARFQYTPGAYSSIRFAPPMGSANGVLMPPAQTSNASYRVTPLAPSNRAPGVPGVTMQAAYPVTNQQAGSQPIAPATQAPIHAYQKYSFFQVHHNRGSSRYRTPYAPGGGFTNGYEGNLRAHLMSTQGAMYHKRGGSFPMGGGLQGLLQPSPQTNYQKPPAVTLSFPTETSSQGSMSGLNGSQLTPSLVTYDPTTVSQKSSSIAPSTASGRSSISGVTMPHPINAQGFGPVRSTSLHPAIRPQYGTSWHQSYTGGVGASQQTYEKPPSSSRGVLNPRIIQKSMPAPIDTVVSTTSQPAQPAPRTDGADASISSSAAVRNASADSRTPQTESPSEQLKLQLHRISDPPHPVHKGLHLTMHPAIKLKVKSYNPSLSVAPPPPREPNSLQQTPPPAQGFQPYLTPQDNQTNPSNRDLALRQTSIDDLPGSVTKLREGPPFPTPVSSSSDKIPLELAEVPSGSMEFIENMIRNLRRASESDDGLSGSCGG